MGLNEFLPPTELIKSIAPEACKDKSPTQKTCIDILFIIGGANQDQLNTVNNRHIHNNK